MLTIVLTHDAVTNLDTSTAAGYARGDVADIISADDTLLLASYDRHLQEFLSRAADAVIVWDGAPLGQISAFASAMPCFCVQAWRLTNFG